MHIMKATFKSNEANVNTMITAAGKKRFSKKMHNKQYKSGLLFKNKKIFSRKLMKLIF